MATQWGENNKTDSREFKTKVQIGQSFVNRVYFWREWSIIFDVLE